MIYDCFAFFNELELLEIRLAELDPIVDRFVLVEATRTFQKKEKPLYFEQNKQRFAKYLPKIEHVVVDQYPGFFAKFRVPTPWDYDNHQKEGMLRGLKNAQDSDLVLVSDLDEIPDARKLEACLKLPGIHVFQQKLFYYYLNCWVKDYQEPIPLYQGYKPWNGSVLLNYAELKKVKTIKEARNLRDHKPPRIQYVQEGGWHFSYIGGVERVLQKIEAYAHTEVNQQNFKVREKVMDLMSRGEDLFGRKITSEMIAFGPETLNQFPRLLREQPEQFRSLLF